MLQISECWGGFACAPMKKPAIIEKKLPESFSVSLVSHIYWALWHQVLHILSSLCQLICNNLCMRLCQLSFAQPIYIFWWLHSLYDIKYRPFVKIYQRFIKSVRFLWNFFALSYTNCALFVWLQMRMWIRLNTWLGRTTKANGFVSSIWSTF